MKHLALFLVLCSACARPAPESYCPRTCVRQEWVGVYPDPNDAARLPWCVCRSERRFAALPPRAP